MSLPLPRDATNKCRYTGVDPGFSILCNHAPENDYQVLAGRRAVFLLLQNPLHWLSGFVTHVVLFIISSWWVYKIRFFIAGIYRIPKMQPRNSLWLDYLSLDWNSANKPILTCPKLHLAEILNSREIYWFHRKNRAKDEIQWRRLVVLFKSFRLIILSINNYLLHRHT